MWPCVVQYPYDARAVAAPLLAATFMFMLTGWPLETTADEGTTPGATGGPPGPMTAPPTRADSRAISSREDTRAELRRSFSVVRYSTLA